MNNKVYNEKINKHQDWGGDESTGGLPVAGGRVQEFIKNELDKRIGVLYYDSTNNRYLAFADTENRDEYINDNTRTDLIIGTFDAPFNYSASIKLISKQVNNIFEGTNGNYIEFTFDTTNKDGSSVGEGIICTYTIIKGSTKKVVTAKYSYGETVRFLIDNYLQVGTNTITIGIQGQNTLAATTVAVVYKVISLKIEDEFDISKVKSNVNQIEIPFTISGQGTKIVNWYIDSVKQDFIKDEDEIIDVTSSRTKYLNITGLNDGVHTLQIQAYTTVDGEQYNSNILYREFIINNNENSDKVYIVTKYTIPQENGIKQLESDNILYDIQQYIDYKLEFAVYNCNKPSYTPVEIYINNEIQTTINVVNEKLQNYTFTQYIPQDITLKLKAGDVEYNIKGKVKGSSLNISEITNGLELAFSGIGKSNSSADKNIWSYNNYQGEFNKFLWNEVSGWTDNSLYIANGSSFAINYSPLGNSPEVTGRTIEISFRTLNVSNDDAVICDLTKNGIGLKITASEAILTSREGVVVSTKFKSEEDVRISFVINRRIGSTNKGLAFIYIDGILSGAKKFALSDSFESSTEFLIKGLNEAEVKLYQLRTYNIALSHDQILNNFILYQKTVKDLQNAYYRNDVLEDDSTNLSVDKLERTLPVMIVTGDIPTLEKTNNKKEQIIVDINYYNLQDPTKSFVAKNIAMTPQGTSSMSYPKKNFRIYTQKIADTILYDYQGKEIKNKLYAFKDGAQPVKTFCLKADYAESSGTHNTGIARLWNKVMYNAIIDGEYKLRTNAQKAAIENDYHYDVRTTVDGFPILMFYRLNADSDLIFIGKYNFNNDKSTESVFGFKDIPGFDNTRMQCWEVLNNGNHLALFTDTDNWENEWKDAFESRYPDVGDDADTTDLKNFATWLVSCKDNKTKFKTEKWQHLDVYKVAAYYIYLMRFGAVDQPVKNAMFTSEDGTHFYFINYDNDTILGVRNDGLLIYLPTITRQSLDTTYATKVYAYAGHDSTLWNLLESDEEFMQIVSIVDNALYQAGLRYADVIDMFNNKQSGKWCERIYNQDAQYKYIGPYVNDGVDNLFMLQGSREAHRKWWLSRRFNLLDSEYVSGAYKSNVLECKMASAPSGIQFSITAGYNMKYGYGVNNVVTESGMQLNIGESTIFTTKQVLNIGDPMRIYSANNIQGVDLSGFIKYLSTVNIASVNDDVLGTKLKKLILGDGVNENTSLSEIQGLSSASRLEIINIEGYKGIGNLNLSKAYYVKEVYANNSGLRSIDLASGNQNLIKLELPNTLQSLILKDLPNLETGLIFRGNNLLNISITGCKKLSTYQLVSILINGSPNLESITIDNIDWQCTANQLLSLVENKTFTYNFKGKVTLDVVDQSIVDRLIAVFGKSAFDKNSAFYIIAPDSIFINGPDIVYEGDTAKYSSIVFSQESTKGTTVYKIQTGNRTGTTLDSNTGVLTTTENGHSDATITLFAQYISTSGKISSGSKQVTIKKRTYPTSSDISNSIKGNREILNIGDTNTYTFELDTSKFTGRFTNEIKWEFTGDLATYAEITYKLNNICKITLNSEVPEVSTGTLKLTLTKFIGGEISGIIAINSKNENIAISKTTNPYVMQAFYKAGLAANENFMTKTECASVIDNDITKDNGFFVNYVGQHDIITFDEFQYFTGLQSIPKSMFMYCKSLTHIIIPSQITIIDESAFKYCESLDISTISFPDNITTIKQYAFDYTKKTTKPFYIPKNCIDFDYFPSNIIEIYCNDIIKENVYNIGYCEIIHLGKSNTGINTTSNNNIYNLKKVFVGNNPNYVGNEDGTILTSGSILILFTSEKENDKIPENVTKIGKYCFNNANLKGSFELPERITEIYGYFNPYSAETLIINCNIKNGVSINKCINLYINKDILYSYDNEAYIRNVENLYIGKDVKYLFTNDKKNSSVDHICARHIIIDENNVNFVKDGGVLINNNIAIAIYETNDGIYGTNIKLSNIKALYIYIETFTGIKKMIIKDNMPSIKLEGLSYLTEFNCLNLTTNIELFNSSASDIEILRTNSTNILKFRFENKLKLLELGDKITSFTNIYYTNTLSNLKEIYCHSITAPTVRNGQFYSSNWHTGANVSDTKTLYVPVNSTGYDEGIWQSELIEKCGFVLSKTL